MLKYCLFPPLFLSDRVVGRHGRRATDGPDVDILVLATGALNIAEILFESRPGPVQSSSHMPPQMQDRS